MGSCDSTLPEAAGVVWTPAALPSVGEESGPVSEETLDPAGGSLTANTDNHRGEVKHRATRITADQPL